MLNGLGDLLRRLRALSASRPGLAQPGTALTPDEANLLFDQGMELNEQGKFDDALEIARELAASRFTGAWEVEAVALHATGDPEGAIRVLEAGNQKKAVWRNGHLLGIYLSDAGRYSEALAAFEASLEMQEPDPFSTAYNMAIAYYRTGDPDRAIAVLQKALASQPADDDVDPQMVERATDFLAILSAPTRRTVPVTHDRRYGRRAPPPAPIRPGGSRRR